MAAVAAGLPPAADRLRVRATVGPAAGRVFSLADLTGGAALDAGAFGAHYVATLEATVAALGLDALAACARGAAAARAALAPTGVREAARLFSEGRAFVVAWVATDAPTTHRVALEGPSLAAGPSDGAPSDGSAATAARADGTPSGGTPPPPPPPPVTGPSCGLDAALDVLAFTRPQRAAIVAERRGLLTALRAARATQAASLATLRATLLTRGALDGRAFVSAVDAAAALAGAVRAEAAATSAFCARVGGVLTPVQGGLYTALCFPRSAACDALAETVAMRAGEPPAGAVLAGAAQG